jgi:hypothetical protein
MQLRESNSSANIKKKKKRKGPIFNICSRKSNSSKNLNSLPSYLSDFTWIENTDFNRILL